MTTMITILLREFDHGKIVARAATIDKLCDQEDISTVSFSKNRLDHMFNIAVPLDDNNDLGFDFIQYANKNALQIVNCRKNTSAARLPQWQSTI